jgi:pre-60S factor REI1
MSQFAEVPVVTKCNTCKAAFASIELIRDHYRSDWHVLNSKRRASGLAHVTLAEYRKQFPNKKKASSSSGSSPSKPKVAVAAPPSAVASSTMYQTSEPRENKPKRTNESKDVPSNPELAQSFTEMAMELGVEGERLESVVSLALATEALADNSDDDAEMEEETEPIIVEPVSKC